MPLTSKVLWIVDMSTPADQAALAQAAQAIGANVVCIRTRSERLRDSIAAFHALHIQVYGWRWPAVVPTTSPPNLSAPDQANFVANVLIPAGLDGYIVDPESDDGRLVDDWQRTDVDTVALARNFCATIKNAAAQTGRPFVFGTTSGCTFPQSKPRIPFAEFFAASDKVYPQTYWRARDDNGNPAQRHGGTPASSMGAGLAAYGAANKPMRPMAGEIDCVTAAEIADYGALLAQHGISEGNFYEFNSNVRPEVLAAIRAL